MKLLSLFFLSIMAMACGSKHLSVTDNPITNTKSPCPENGTCTFEVLEGKVLNIQKDNFGNLYPELLDGESVVLKFEFKRDEIPDTVDGNYSELIFMQLDSKQPEMQLEDLNLQNVKLLFGRLCFCRGQTGYYKIDKGALSVAKLDGDTYQLHLDFKCDEVPQIIEMLNETFKL